MTRQRQLLTFGHSYVVALNRRLPHEMARIGRGRWNVVAAAPSFVHGDLRPIALESFPGEACQLEHLKAYLTKRPHVMMYGSGLRNLLAKEWDLIHCWEEPFTFPAAQAAYWARKKKIVYYSYQNINKRYPPPFNWIERFAMDRSTGWVAGAEMVRETLLKRPIYPNRRHRVITLGVDTSIFRPDVDAKSATLAELEWAPDGPPVVGYLGRFSDEKGLPMLLRVLDAIRSDFRALFVGGGPLESVLRSIAERSPKKIRVITGVPHGEVPRYLNTMDILVAPSQTTLKWREQLGRMLIEGFACGIPVIGSNSGEIPHVIGDVGAIVGENDEAGWKTVLEELIESPARRQDLGKRGRNRAEEEFAWPIIAQRHLDFFDELIDSFQLQITTPVKLPSPAVHTEL